jgi:hypothetical protein
MYESPNGEYVRGYLASDTMNADADIPLFDRDGNARVLKAGERLVLNFITINNGATAATVSLYADKNGGGTVDAGEELYRAAVAVNAQNFMDSGELHFPKVTATGGKLRVHAAVASVGSTIVVIGFILNT